MQQAAEREVLEETGINISAKMPLCTFDVVDRDQDGRVRFHYVIVDLSAEYISGDPVAGDDADEAAWICADRLVELKVNRRTRALLHRLYRFGEAPD